jgi:hypothetical protein
MIFFAGNKGDSSCDIERDSVRVLNAGEWISTYDLIGGGIDDDEEIETVDCYEYVSRARIVDGVSRSAAERNFGNEVVAGCVDDGVDAPVFIGDKDFLFRGSVCQAIGIVDWAGGADDPERLSIDSGDLMVSGDRCVESMDLGRGDHSMHAWKAVEISDDLTRWSIENDKLVGIHVSDIQATARGIERLIIESNCGAGQGDVGDDCEGFFSLRIADGGDRKEAGDQATDEPSQDSMI